MYTIGANLDVMDEPHVEDKHEEDAYLQLLVKSHDEKYFGQALAGFEKKYEESLDMEKVVENMTIELARKCDCIFMDWVDIFITKIEAQGCTSLPHICK